MTAARTVELTVPTADGTALAATLVHPDVPTWPAVLVRTPYGRRNLLAEAGGWAAYGFGCLVVDVRGRGASGGCFRPYDGEAADGVAALDRLRDLPGCDGRVVLAGASYGAHCAVATAAAAGGDVCGVLAAVPALGRGETAREPGGAARLACRVGWWTEHGARAGPSSPACDPLRALPVLDQVPGEPIGWRELWDAPVRDPELWAGIRAARTPLLAVGGLADPFAAQVAELAECWGGPSRLLLGPWGHELDAAAPGAALAGRRIGAVYARWARAAVDGRLAERGAVVAVDAAGGWRRMAPVPALRVQPAAGREFVADPQRPFRSLPPGAPVPSGPDRRDHAVLRTPPLPAGELRGPVEVRLTVATGAPDADWVVRLTRAAGPGRRVLTTAVARHRDPDPLVRIVTPPVGTTLVEGEVLTVEIAGHHWPAHARNPHTGVDPVRATALRTDRRRVDAVELHLPHHPAGADAVPAHTIAEEIAR